MTSYSLECLIFEKELSYNVSTPACLIAFMTCAPDVGEVCPDVLSWRAGDHGGEVALQEQPGLLAEELVTLGHLEHVDSLRDNLDGRSTYVCGMKRRGERA